MLSLALLNADHHALTIDVGGLQTDGFKDSQPCRVTGRENGAMLRAGHTGQKMSDLFGTEHDGQLLGLLRCGNYLLETPLFVKGDVVEKAQGADCNKNRAGGQLRVRTNLLGTQALG
jgi:hypothetical protein